MQSVSIEVVHCKRTLAYKDDAQNLECTANTMTTCVCVCVCVCMCVCSPRPLSPNRSTPPNKETAPAGFFFAGTAAIVPGNRSSGGGDWAFVLVEGRDERGSPLWVESDEANRSLSGGFVGGACGFFGFFGSDTEGLVPSGAANRSSPWPGAASLGTGNETSVFAVLAGVVVNRSPPRGSLVGGDPNRSEGSGLTCFTAGFAGLLLDGLVVMAGAEVKSSSTCGFFLAFPEEGVVVGVAEEGAKRSSSDSSSSNNPPSFSFGFAGALLTLALTVVGVLLSFVSSPSDPVTWLLGAVAGVGLVGGAPNSSPSSRGGLGEPKRLSERGFAVTGGVAFVATASEPLPGLSI